MFEMFVYFCWHFVTVKCLLFKMFFSLFFFSFPFQMCRLQDAGASLTTRWLTGLGTELSWIVLLLLKVVLSSEVFGLCEISWCCLWCVAFLFAASFLHVYLNLCLSEFWIMWILVVQSCKRWPLFFNLSLFSIKFFTGSGQAGLIQILVVNK